MDGIVFDLLNENNFALDSLDNFERHQTVTECLRHIDGEWKYIHVHFEEYWDLSERKEKSDRLISCCTSPSPTGFAYIAKHNGSVVGYAFVLTELLGEKPEYMQLTSFQVSEPFRGKGIGKQLFHLAAQKAKGFGAKKLYISASSAKETQAAYNHLNCVHAEWIYQAAAEEEPCDVQMEFVL